MKTIQIESDTDLVFEEAQKRAVAEAQKHLNVPMTLSWLNRKVDRHFPNVDCCQEDGKESWEIYAESRGGTIRVEVGDWYVFIFREGAVTN